MNPRRSEKHERPTEPVILFGVGEYTFAISATAVEEIRNVGGLMPLPVPVQQQFPTVRSMLTHAKCKYFVVDAAEHFRMLPVPGSRLLLLRKLNTAVLVERIDKMAEIRGIHGLPRVFRGEERNWFNGLAVFDEQGGDVVPVVNPQSFLSTAEIAALKRQLAELGQ